MHSCIDPPEEKTPGSRPGVKTEPSHNNSSLVPERNLNLMLIGETPEVKPHPQQVVDKKEQGTTGGVKNGGGISPDQQELLNSLNPSDHHLGLLLALNGMLGLEHCEAKIVCDNWDLEILRRAKMFSER